MPIFMVLVMGLIDFSWMELKTSQISSAARDGGRAGIVTSYKTAADDQTSCTGTQTDFITICNAVVKRLAGTTVSRVRVECHSGLTTTAIACTSAHRGIDSLWVSVWTVHTPLTFVGQTYLGSSVTYNRSAQMAL